jgi:hypothetical protein
MATGSQRPPKPVSPRKRGRTIAGAIYYGLIGAVCLAGTVQISMQVFQPPAPAPYASCRDGLRALVGAVERARGAAPGTDGEDAALERFRAALEPEWGHFDGVAEKCKGGTNDEGALDAIERLRYAEEHAVRREAGDLAPLRRRVQTIVETDLTERGAPPQGPAGLPEKAPRD